MSRDYLITVPPVKEVGEIMNVLEEKLGVHILVHKNDSLQFPNYYFDIVVSSSENAMDVLLDRELLPLEWPCSFTSGHDINKDRGKRGGLFEKAVYGVVSWISRGNVLYKSSRNHVVDIFKPAIELIYEDKIEKYAEIPPFQNVTELKMKLDLRGVT